MKTVSVKKLLDDYGGVFPGFDALRLILSIVAMLYRCAVIYFTFHFVAHDPSSLEVNPYGLYELWLKPFLRGLAPAYFFMSGLLVTGSALRVKSARVFLTFRILRAFPPLLAEVILTSVLMGGVLTRLPLSTYYTHPRFFKYFLNMVCNVQLYLPGVDINRHSVEFTSLPIQGHLWSAPLVICVYAILAILIMLRAIFSRRLFFWFFAYFSFFVAAIQVLNPKAMIAQSIFGIPTYGIPIAGVPLIYSFFAGTFVYLFSDRILISRMGMILAFISLIFFKWDQTIILGISAVCYITLCIGFADLREFPLVRRGNYSCGIYLYGLPVAQTLNDLFPALGQSWWILSLATTPITLFLAFLSWHFIERPISELKRKLWPAVQMPHPEILTTKESVLGSKGC